MGVFANVSTARATEGGSYFEPDHEWLVLINEIKNGKTRKEVENFIVECKVLKSTCDKARPGSERSMYVDMSKDAAAGNVAHFVMQATGCDQSEINEAGILEMCSTRQPLAGHVMALQTYNKPTKAGNPFTRHKWREATPAEIKEATEITKKLGLKMKGVK